MSESGGSPLPGPLRLAPAFPFVGRLEELATLRRLWLEIDEGGRVAFVAGDPGTGKSRLIREFAHQVADEGIVLYGVCDPVVGIPYQPLVESLTHLLRHTDPTTLQAELGPTGGELVRLFPDLTRLVAGLATSSQADADIERHRLHTAVSDLLINVSGRRPVALIFDDLHWADRSTLLLLRHLVRATVDARVLVIGAFRDASLDLGSAFTDTLADLRRLNGVARLRLGGLDSAGVGELVARLADADVDEELTALASEMHELTGGNAFLVGELWRHLLETGSLGETADGWRLTVPLGELGTPDSVREVVGQRLSRLTSPTADLLATAAIIGGDVDLNVLRHASDVDEATLLQALEEAIDSGMVQPAPSQPRAIQFTHELVRRALYDRLNPITRARVHLRVAQALEVLPGGDMNVVGELATHFSAAAGIGAAGKAVEYSLRAADLAVRQLAYDQAATRLRTALDLGVVPEMRGQVHLQLGAALLRAGSWLDALDSFRSAAAAARETGDHDLLAQAAIGFEDTCWRPALADQGAAELLEEALDAVDEGDSRLRVRLLAVLARARGYQGDRELAVAARVAAVAMAQRIGDRHGLALALAQSYWARGDDSAEAVLAMMVEARDLAEDLGDPELRGIVQLGRLPLLAELGRFDALRHEVRASRRVAERLGQDLFLHQFASCASALALLDGRLDAAEAMAGRALELSRSQGYDGSGVYGIQMFGIRREQDRLAELAPLVRALAAGGSGSAVWRPGLCVLYAELGMHAEARRELAHLCVDGCAVVPRDALRLGALTYLADACSLLGDAEHAAMVYEQLRGFAGTVVQLGRMVACYGVADRHLGMLAATMHDWERAELHFEAALRLNRRMQAVTWLAHTRYEYARMLLARRRPGDAERASDLLEHVHRTATRTGLSALLAPSERLMAGSSELPDGLTERELEVLRLVARGHSNREIGRELFISQNTAANHVRSILMKTRCANRTEAASYAHRNRLLDAPGLP